MTEEGIGNLLASHSSGGTVAGINHRVVREGEQPFPDGFEETTHIAARKIRATNASLEKSVAGDKEMILRIIKTYASG